jgi:hypothetical protein
MALQIRRGTDAERQLIIPLQGELIFTTDTKKLFVGDGTTLGGVDVDTTGSGGEGGATLLEDLTNVLITSPASGQVLKYNGTNWTNSTDLTGGSSISDISDIPGVSISNLQSGQVLTYNGFDWVNDDIEGTGTISSIGLIQDVSITNVQAGQVLKYNGVDWVNAEDEGGVGSSISDLSDIPGVSITNVQAGQVLKYNGVDWVNDEDTGVDGTLNDLLDVNIFDPQTGHILEYNGTTWANRPFSELSISIDNIQEVSLISPAAGEFLQFNGVVWSNSTISIENISDISLTNLETDEFLKWDGSTWVNSKLPSSLTASIVDELDNIVLDINTSALSIDTIYTGEILANSIAPLRIGTTSNPISSLDVFTNGSFNITHAGVDSTWIELQSSNGTLESPTVLNPGQITTGIIFEGWNGTDFANYATIAGRIEVSYDGVSPNIPGSLFFITKNSSGDIHNAILTSGGTFITRALRSTGFVDEADRATRIPSPVTGLIAYMQNSSRFSYYAQDTGLATGGSASGTPGWVYINASLT